MAATTILDFESAPVNPKGLPTSELARTGYDDDKKGGLDEITVATYDVGAREQAEEMDSELIPTEEDLLTLRKVAAPLPWAGVAMCLIEFAERASYYGCKGPFNNFINRPLPIGGNGAGAVAPGAAGLNQSAGALGLGSVTATALVQMFNFLAYVMPIVGGIISDTKWGRFKTIAIGAAVGAVAHFILVVPAVPSIINNPNGSLAAFIISILILAAAAGFIKPCLGPLLCDQSPVRHPTLKVLPSGERVILDPTTTIQRYLLVFYWCINVGSFFAVATTYSARLVGFWLAFLMPGVIYMLMPIVLVIVYKRLYKAPPQGSVVAEAAKVFKKLLADGGWRRMWKGGDAFWDRAKPSVIQEQEGMLDVTKVFWDDKFVDEIRQTISACAVFALIPIFTLGNGGIGNSLNSMSGSMTLNGVPNDLIDQFNALAIILFAPILNFGLYPLFARYGKPIKPMTRMTIGFLMATFSDIVAAVVQWKIYQESDCGYYASTCDTVTSISIWLQIPIVMVPAVGELFVNVTSYELAYTRSPARMKALVYALALFNSAVAAAISLACAKAIDDPYLIWPWVALAVSTFGCACLFPTYFKHLNIPMEQFADKDRMAGADQPTALDHKARGEE
ncbi:POT family-domain-containing protein [Dioszegia hungarica]|uniref:POT family-domain-containing protein n=1 Tax=Dioszegia hungarica TaxID=4972 RepID=A0AA38H5E2_9TREE|nr:POT family-domain-containing protein [Dioszegia hungarica]KAI9632829.1 POT family-domain-containing protein [Dioszegia hungarica]